MRFKPVLLFNAPNDGDGSSSTSSEGDPNATGTSSTGASADGGNGDAATVEQLAAERDRIEAERRALQADRDRLRAENEKLKKPVDAPKTDPAPLQAADVMQLLRREREMATAVVDLRGEFKMADPAIFSRVDDFDSVEAFRAAVESSHLSFEARLAGLDVVPKSEVEALRQQYAAKFGDLGGGDPPNSNGGDPGGLPTFEQLHAMSFRELDAFIAKHGDETYQRILRSAQEATQ